MFNVTFTFNDQLGRVTTKKIVNANTLIADVLTDIVAIAPLWQAIIQGGLTNVVISQEDKSQIFAPSAEESNVDEGARVQVVGGNGFNYSFAIPMPRNDLRQQGGVLNVADPDVAAFFAVFDGQTGNNWRIDSRNPQIITTVVSGTVDK